MTASSNLPINLILRSFLKLRLVLLISFKTFHKIVGFLSEFINPTWVIENFSSNF